MKRILLLLSLLLLAGCASTQEQFPASVNSHAGKETAASETSVIPSNAEFSETLPVPDPIETRIASMSLEERVGQLFLARCNAATAVTDIQKYHLGGFVLFGVDFQNETPESLSSRLVHYQQTANIPLLIAVDEEGGTVTRVSRYPAFRSSPFPSPRYLFENLGYDAVLDTEAEKCRLLSSLGINVNLGPVCDITTDSGAFMYSRSLGQAPATTARFIMDTVQIMKEHGIGSTLKHFPGYGNNDDTHIGIARDSRSLQELENLDLIPFRSGISAGCDAILISHTIADAWDPELPASLSPAVHRYLREQMGFDGAIVTDDLVMQAITDRYGAGEAAVMAVLAGNDLLCSSEYAIQYEAVLAAVLDGRIHLRVLNEAVRHVLLWKAELGLI